MARTPFQVEVLTPEGEVFNEEVEMLSTRTATGSIGVLANHTPLLALLDAAELRLYTSENEYRSFVQGEGYLQVGGNRALVLVEEASDPKALDAADLREKLRKAEDALSKCDAGTEEQRRCARDKNRWETFLKIAEGGTPK